MTLKCCILRRDHGMSLNDVIAIVRVILLSFEAGGYRFVLGGNMNVCSLAFFQKCIYVDAPKKKFKTCTKIKFYWETVLHHSKTHLYHVIGILNHEIFYNLSGEHVRMPLSNRIYKIVRAYSLFIHVIQSYNNNPKRPLLIRYTI